MVSARIPYNLKGMGIMMFQLSGFYCIVLDVCGFMYYGFRA